MDKPVTDEIAGVGSDIFTGYTGTNALNPDKVLRTQGGGRGVDIYEDLMDDPQVRACMQSRKLAVVGREWEVLPATDGADDIRRADFVRDALLEFDFDSARLALLDGIVTGYKPAEILWEYSEGSAVIKDILGRSPRRFVFDSAGRLRLLTFKNMAAGEPVPERKFVVYSYGTENGSPYGRGLGRTLYWPVWFKKNAVKFWMVFAEKFGSPTVIGKYPAGTTKEQQDALMGALETIQQESAIKVPDTMELTLLEAQRSSTVSTYEGLLAFMNAEIAKTVLGQTLTTDAGSSGSYALSKTHDEVRKDYIKADADLLCNRLNSTLVRWLVDFNFPRAKGAGRRYPKLWIRVAEEGDLKPLAERDEVLVRLGLPVAKKYFYDTYGIPLPSAGEETL